mgnify:FL=1
MNRIGTLGRQSAGILLFLDLFLGPRSGMAHGCAGGEERTASQWWILTLTCTALRAAALSEPDRSQGDVSVTPGKP